MKTTNFTGIIVFLLTPCVYVATIYIVAKIKPYFSLIFNEFTTKMQPAFLLFVVSFWMSWHLIKRIKSPELSDQLMVIIIGLFAFKGLFKVFFRFEFNPWVSLWLFAPFLLIACTKGEGWQYLKKYLWYPIVLDSFVLAYNILLSEIILDNVKMIKYILLLLAHIVLFVGFVKYTVWTYDPIKPRWYIPTTFFAIPAFMWGSILMCIFLIGF